MAEVMRVSELAEDRVAAMIGPLPLAIHLNLDDAWDPVALEFPTIEARRWGSRLRFSSPSSALESFYDEIGPQLGPFILYGSGDFHHLTALWLRRATAPTVVVSFDNHPDWDIRPPNWCCGGWVNRALELAEVKKVEVWGCGNFKSWWPGQLFGNRRAEREGKLTLHPWAIESRPTGAQRRGAIFRATWRSDFERFVTELSDGNFYVTVDLDCLGTNEAVTNWENGKFTADELIWALGRLHARSKVIGGDICGAYSEAKYARWGQRFLSQMDRPNLPKPDAKRARAVNHALLQKVWPVFINYSGSMKPSL